MLKKKSILLIAILVNDLLFRFLLAEDKDMVFDAKTSFLVPKYLGTIKKIKGKAFAEERELAMGVKVYPGETIKTLESSFLIIDIVDDTTITLGPNSQFTVKNWEYHTKNDRNGTYDLTKGQWRALIRSKSKNNSKLTIKTPLVAMGVRGTELLVNQSHLSGKEMTQVALLEGSIELKSEDLKLSKMMKPGDHEIIYKEGSKFIVSPKKLEDLELKLLNQESEKDVANLLAYAKIEDLIKENGGITHTNESELNQQSNDVEVDQSLGKNRPTFKEKLNKLNTIRTKNN